MSPSDDTLAIELTQTLGILDKICDGKGNVAMSWSCGGDGLKTDGRGASLRGSDDSSLD